MPTICGSGAGEATRATVDAAPVVDHQGVAADIGRLVARQVERGVGDVDRIARPAVTLPRLLGDSVEIVTSPSIAAVNAVGTVPGAIALQRTPFGPSSDSDRLGEPDHRGLGRCVRVTPEPADHAGDARRVDDRAMALRRLLGPGVARTVPHSVSRPRLLVTSTATDTAISWSAFRTTTTRRPTRAQPLCSSVPRPDWPSRL